MKTYLYIIIFLLSGNSFLAQESSEVNDLLVNAEENIYINPDESVRIATQILKNTNTNLKVFQANIILSKSYFAKGELEEAIGYFFEGKKLLKFLNNDSTHLDFLLYGTTLFKNIGFYEITKDLKNEGEEIFKSHSNESLALYFNIHKRWLETESIQKGDDLKQLLDEFKNSTEFQNQKFLAIKSQILNSLGKIYFTEGKIDSSNIYFEKALKSQRKIHSGSLQEAYILVDYSKYFYEFEQNQTAIDTLKKALNISKIFNNPFLDNAIYNELSQNYLVLKNKEKYIESYLKVGLSLSLIKSNESAASNAIFNILLKNHTDNKEELKKEFLSTKWAYGTIAVLILILGLFIRWFTAFKLKHARDIINYLKLIQDSEKKEEPQVKGIVKSLGIAKETETLLLKKLEAFEKSNKFTSKEMSLAQMASQFETNTKYLSEVINKHKGKNFNLYVNNLRVKYIVKKLKTEPNYLNYKVSYLAEESGFSSHSSFATVFKTITGISPNVFIELLKKDLKKSKQMSA